MNHLFVVLVLVLAVALAANPASAQDYDLDPPLDEFFDRVAEVWTEADVPAIVALIAADDRLVLDTGTGIQGANSRHAAAALRALFSQSETVTTRARRVTLTSTSPARGFGELDWTFRVRGAPGERSRSVYVAAAWQNDAWRITELRLMP